MFLKETIAQFKEGHLPNGEFVPPSPSIAINSLGGYWLLILRKYPAPVSESAKGLQREGICQISEKNSFGLSKEEA